MTDEHELEQGLTATLERRAAQVRPSADGLARIEGKVRARRRQRIVAIAASVVVLVLVAGAIVVVSRGDQSAKLNVVDDSELEGAVELPGDDLLLTLVDLEAGLENEMVLGAASLASEGTQYGPEYEEDVAVTDQAIAAVDAALAAYETSDPEAAAAAAALETRLEDLDTVRRGTRGDQFKTSVHVDQYLETIDTALDLDRQVSREASSAQQYRLIRASTLLGEIGRETADTGAIVSAVAASPSKRFSDSEGIPCTSTAAESCSSWQDVESGLHGRDALYEDLALLGLGLDAVGLSFGDAARAAGNSNGAVALDSVAVVDEAVAAVSECANRRQSVLRDAAALPAVESVPLDQAQLAPLLDAAENERTVRVELLDASADERPALVEQLNESAVRRRQLAAEVQDVEAIDELEALNEFLDGEARAALELGILSALVARDPQLLTGDEFPMFTEAQAAADEAFLEWSEGATDEQKSRFRNETSTAEVRAADDMIDRAFTSGNERRAIEPPIDRDAWALARQNKIDAYETVEYALIDALDG